MRPSCMPSLPHVCAASLAVVFPAEGVPVAVGLFRHQVVLVHDVCGLSEGVGDGGHVSLPVISVGNERLRPSLSYERQACDEAPVFRLDAHPSSGCVRDFRGLPVGEGNCGAESVRVFRPGHAVSQAVVPPAGRRRRSVAFHGRRPRSPSPCASGSSVPRAGRRFRPPAGRGRLRRGRPPAGAPRRPLPAAPARTGHRHSARRGRAIRCMRSRSTRSVPRKGGRGRRETKVRAFVNHNAADQVHRLETHLTELFGQFLGPGYFLHDIALEDLVIELCKYLLAQLAAAFPGRFQHGTESDAGQESHSRTADVRNVWAADKYRFAGGRRQGVGCGGEQGGLELFLPALFFPVVADGEVPCRCRSSPCIPSDSDGCRLRTHSWKNRSSCSHGR